MLPAPSWLVPATVPQADTNMPAPRTAKIVSARLNPRNRSRSGISISCDPFIETEKIIFAYDASVSLFYRNQIANNFGKYLYGVSLALASERLSLEVGLNPR
jgi:hypothetical protein